MKSNILVTGGLGFIGSHYARLLVNSGYNVSILDKMTYASDIRRIEYIKDNVNLYTGDICDRELCNEIILFNDIDIIVNFAAETMVDRSINDSKPFIHSNYVGVWNLLEICRKNDNNIRFLQVGTDEVYGSTTYDDQSFKETDKLNPGNPYAASKASADLLTLSYFNTYNSNVIITRSSNNMGEYQDKEKLIPNCITNAIKGESLKIYGDGSNIRDWLYVSDNCLGIKVVMEKGRNGEIYNIGAGNELTNNQVVKIIAERFGVGIRYIVDRPGHDKHYSINCNKIMNELGWEPMMEFEEGLKRTIDWYVNQNQ